jgi:hypothetical protein
VGRIGSTLAGLTFIALGMFFLLDRFTDFRLPGVHAWWPVALVFFGAMRLIRGALASGVTLVLLGTVFLASSMGMLGSAHGLVGPMIVVSVGIGLVIRAIAGPGSYIRGGSGAPRA